MCNRLRRLLFLPIFENAQYHPKADNPKGQYGTKTPANPAERGGEPAKQVLQSIQAGHPPIIIVCFLPEKCVFLYFSSPLSKGIFCICRIMNGNLSEICKSVVEKHGFFLLDIKSKVKHNVTEIEVYADGEQPLTVEHCAAISRELYALLEENGDTDFSLLISSPGVDKPLKFIQQYTKHINRSFDLELVTPEGSKKAAGTLVRIQDGAPVFMISGTEQVLPLQDILSAKVKVSFK